MAGGGVIFEVKINFDFFSKPYVFSKSGSWTCVVRLSAPESTAVSRPLWYPDRHTKF
jgi:hypothetical protein